ncbi:uncharacterized protein [Spinacia oleracea]|uniref:Uncharacterized protein n=1 Tax=Spinacia oleracea TaxID=3562 RepID=A0A9R0IX28_SPIOL|nr:uncharacterized protein LOC110796376 [Spinacia oleracea]
MVGPSSSDPNSSNVVDLRVRLPVPPENSLMTIKLASVDRADPGVQYVLLPSQTLVSIREDYQARLGYGPYELAICLFQEYAKSLDEEISVAENEIKDGELIYVLPMYDDINADTSKVRFDILQEDMFGSRLYAMRHRVTTKMQTVYQEWANHIRVPEGRVMLFSLDEFGNRKQISRSSTIQAARITNHSVITAMTL